MISSVVSGLKTKFIQGWPRPQGADRMASAPQTAVAAASSGVGQERIGRSSQSRLR